jgi:glycosyltransferase involved in cell wall biosynthesis
VVEGGVNDGQTVELRLDTPVSVVNYPVKKHKTTKVSLPELKHDINFLCVAQMGPRKNLGNTIQWFLQEFHNDDVGLVIKTNRSRNCLMDRILSHNTLRGMVEQYPDKKCSIYLLHGDMSDEEIHSLYKHEKISAFLTLTHGEGFGLPIFEALYSDLPVIAPGWSGQVDFLYDDNNKEQFYSVSYDIRHVQKEAHWEKVILEDSMWCWPREQSAKEQMRQCYNDILNNEGHVKNVKKYSRRTRKIFSKENIYKAFVDAVCNNEQTKWEQMLADVELV